MQRKVSTKCSTCNERTVALVTIPYDTLIFHDGKHYDIHVPDLMTPKCANCGQLYFDQESSEQVNRALRAKVGLMQPDEIRQTRETLNLEPQAIAEMLCIPISIYASWEEGGFLPLRSQDRLLRLVLERPEVRQQLREMHARELTLAG